MKFATFTQQGATRIGIVEGEEVLDLSAAAPELPRDMLAFIEAGELRQDGNTKELIFDCYDLIEHLSTSFTLEPGDVIATGTPSGVGIAMQPPKLLRAGDVVRIEIEGIGWIENAMIDEPEGTRIR